MDRWIRSCTATGTGVIAVEIETDEMNRLRKADTAAVIRAWTREHTVGTALTLEEAIALAR